MRAINQTNDSGYIIAGKTDFGGAGQMSLIKTNASGQRGCHESAAPTAVTIPSLATFSHAVTENTGGNVIGVAIFAGSGGVVSAECASVGMDEILFSNSFSISPNPSKGNFVIALERAIRNANLKH